MAAKETGYTHGHHESVLRSHRWRTAENSAAHLLPYLQPATADALVPACARLFLGTGAGRGSISAPEKLTGTCPAREIPRQPVRSSVRPG
jgi:hypothetical protein